jgi:hypothetical protein
MQRIHSKVMFLSALIALVPSFQAGGQSPPQPSPQVPVTALPPAPAKTPPSVCAPLPPAPVQYQLVPVQQPYAAAPVVQYSAPTAWYGATAAPRTIVMGPGPISLGLAAVGDQLVKLRKTHVWTIGHTALTQVQPAPLASPSVYFATTVMPVQQQPVQQVQYQMVPVQAPAAPPAVYRGEEAPPVPVAPSPQAVPRHPLFQGVLGK